MKKPIIRVYGQSGDDLVPGWGSALETITITDNEGGDADEIEITFSVAPPFPAPPAEGTQYRVAYGWLEAALRDGGLYTFQSAHLNKSEGDAWTMSIVARAADFVSADKSADSGHFEDTTAGKIFEALAKEAGKSAVVADDVASIEIPYRLRHRQSAVGFAQALADELGGTMKLSGGKWIVSSKGSAMTAGGSAIAPIVIDVAVLVDAGLTAEAKGKYEDIEAGYFDEATGQWVVEKTGGAGKAGRATVLHPAASKAEAKKRASAEAAALARTTVTGNITLDGDTAAMAGAPIILSGFGGWTGTDLRAASIEHSFTFDNGGGWLMTVEIAAKNA